MRASTRSRRRCAQRAASSSSGSSRSSTMDRIEAELEPYLVRPRRAATSSPASTRAAPARCSRGRRRSVHLAAHPIVLGALDRVLGDHATSYQLHLTQVIEIGPGEPAQLVHRDQWAFDFFPFPVGLRGRVPHDVGDDRLHRGERRDARHPRQPPLGRQAPPDGRRDRCPPRCRRARCCFYLGSLYHGGGANRSATRRGAA